MANASCRASFVLEAQQEFGIVEELAIENLKRNRTVAHPDLFG